MDLHAQCMMRYAHGPTCAAELGVYVCSNRAAATRAHPSVGPAPPSLLQQAGSLDLELVTAAPEANGFFGSKGVSGACLKPSS